MFKILGLVFPLFIVDVVTAQKIEKVFLNRNDSTTNMFIAVVPATGSINSCLFLLDGFGASPEGVLIETNLPNDAAAKGILTIIPVLKTGPLYFGSDGGSQESLKDLIELVTKKIWAK